MSRSERIKEITDRRFIDHILHFTRVENLPGIVKAGILSRNEIRAQQLLAYGSSTQRWDGNDDAVSASISRIYYKMFKAKEKEFSHDNWVILLLDRRILWTLRCNFFSENASRNWMKRQARSGSLSEPDALERMFEDWEMNGQSARQIMGKPSYLPTNDGAEVQILEPIDPKFIVGAWVEQAELIEPVNVVLSQLPQGACDVRVGGFYSECPFDNRQILRHQAQVELAGVYNEFSVDDYGGGVYLSDGMYVTCDGRLVDRKGAY